MNIYKLARENAGITQYEAAPLIYSNLRSLSDFEMGYAIPKDDIVCRMIEVYEAPWLAYQHLSISSRVGREYLPKLEVRSLAQSVLFLQKEVDDVMRDRYELASIAIDDRIDEAEKPTWDRINQELAELVRAALAIMFIKKEKDLRSA